MTKEFIRKEEIHTLFDEACKKERDCLLALGAKREECALLDEIHKAALSECVRLGAEMMEECE